MTVTEFSGLELMEPDSAITPSPLRRPSSGDP